MSLHVKPISALLTRDTEIFSKMDPYVVAIVGVEKQRSRTHQQGGKKPKWTDEFIFRAKASSMLVTVYDEDIVSDDVVGSANIELKKYYDNPIEHEENVKICFEGKESGTLKLIIQYKIANQGGQNFIPIPNQFNNNSNNSSWNQQNLNWQAMQQQSQPQNLGWDTMQQNINMNASIKNSLTGLIQPNSPPQTNTMNVWQNVFNATVNKPNNYPPVNGNGWESQSNNGWGSTPPQNSGNNNGWGPTPNSNGWGSTTSDNGWGSQPNNNNGWGSSNNNGNNSSNNNNNIGWGSSNKNGW